MNNAVKPNNNMALAIFTTICCCLPVGIYAIVKAAQVNNLFATQQYEQAQAAANEAKKWSMIGIGVGLVINIIYVLLYATGTISGLGQQ